MFLRPSQPSGPSIFSSQKPTHPSSGNHREQSHVGFTAALKHSCLGLIQTFLLVYSFVHFTWSFYFMCSRFNVVAELSLKDFTKFEWTSVVFNIIIGAHLQVLLHHKKKHYSHWGAFQIYSMLLQLDCVFVKVPIFNTKTCVTKEEWDNTHRVTTHGPRFP